MRLHQHILLLFASSVQLATAYGSEQADADAIVGREESSSTHATICEVPVDGLGSANLSQSFDRDILMAGGPFCGVQSLAACLNAVGIFTDVKDLATPEYVGSTRGSDAVELVAAAENMGAVGRCFQRMSYQDLKLAQCPMVLHFRDTNGSRQFTHWVAFLGRQDGQFRILDIPHETQLLEPAEMLALWDGIAIEIRSPSMPGGAKWLHSTRVHRTFIAANTMCVLAIVLYYTDRLLKVRACQYGGRRLLVFNTASGVVIATIAVGMALVYHLMSPVGYFKNRVALAEVLRRYGAEEVTEVDYESTFAAIHDGSAILVDARREQDFRRGAIPTAINLPVGSTLEQRRTNLSELPHGAAIIVYCKSRGCRYSDEIAAFLQYGGYSDVSIYREGYMDWVRHSSTE